MDEHRQPLLERLDALIAAGPPRRVVFALPGGHPPAGAAMVPGARLSVVTAGCKHILAWNGRELVDHRLEAGAAMVMPPYGWTLPRYDSARTILGIVRHRDFTRFLWSVHPGRGPANTAQHWFHTARPLPAAAAQALGALSELANGGPPVAAQQLWVFLNLAREELAHAPAIALDRARVTWSALCEHVHQHLDRELSRDQLARRFRLHPSYVSLLFSRVGGEPFGAYLTRLRLERATELLRGEMTVTEVARRCGFADPGYFIKVFRARYGASPGLWRRSRCLTKSPERYGIVRCSISPC